MTGRLPVVLEKMVLTGGKHKIYQKRLPFFPNAKMLITVFPKWRGWTKKVQTKKSELMNEISDMWEKDKEVLSESAKEDECTCRYLNRWKENLSD